MSKRTHRFYGLVLSLFLHAALLCLWDPHFLKAEKIHVSNEFELLSYTEKAKPAPTPPKKKEVPPKKRPCKARRIVKKSTVKPVIAPTRQERQVTQSAPPAGPAPVALAEEPVQAHADVPPTEIAEASALSRAAVLNLYASQIRQRIETNKTYPHRARRQNMEGAVRIRFVLSPAGNVKEITIIRASRFAMLNTAAKKAVLSAAPFPSLPDHIKKKPISLEVTLCFKLT